MQSSLIESATFVMFVGSASSGHFGILQNMIYFRIAEPHKCDLS
jgi:hypothetical protein